MSNYTTFKKCAECKRRFYVPDVDMYAYKHEQKDRMKYFCSWTCMRKWEKRVGWKPSRRYIEERARRES